MEEKKIVLSIETITDKNVMEAYGETLDRVLGSYEENTQALAEYNLEIKRNKEVIEEINKLAQKGVPLTEEQVEVYKRLTAENMRLANAKAKTLQILKSEEKIALATAGSMEEQSLVLGKLREAWRAMSDEQKKSNQGMLETIQQLDEHLKESDAEIGNFQRNVGNYAGGIAQALARLDILPDKIGQYVSAVGRLQAGLKSVSSVMGVGAVKSAKAFIMSLSGVKKAMLATGVGIVVVAIGTLIAYWDDLKKIIENTNPERKAARATRELNAEISKLAAQSAADKVVRVKELAFAYSQLGDNLNAKKKFVIDYKDELGKMGIEVNNVNDAEKVLRDETENYIKALMARAKADAIRRKASKDYEAGLEQIAEAEKNMQEAFEGPLGINLLSSGLVGLAISAYRYKSAAEEVATTTEDLDKNLKKAFESALEYEKQAAEWLKDDKSGGSGGGGGKTDEEKQAERELKAIEVIQHETWLASLNAKDRELEIARAKYEEKKALLEKYGKDTSKLEEVYNREVRAINQKYYDLYLQDFEEWKEKQAKEIKASTDVAKKELDEIINEILSEDIVIDKVAESRLARWLGVTDEQLSTIKKSALSAAKDIFSSISKMSHEAIERRLDDELDSIDREAESEKAILEAKLENNLITQKEYEKKLAELDAETEARKEEANKDAFNKKKAWSIGQAIINGALAVTNIWSQWGAQPIVAGILTGIAATANAIEIATIAAQKYARGGELHGPSHAQGGIKGFVGNQHIEAEGGEIIINKRSSAKHRKLLSLINSDNGWGDDFASARGGSGRFFARGGVLGGYDFRTSPLPDTRSGLMKFAQQQTANVENAINAINQRIDNLRVYLPLSDIEQRSNEKRVHIARAVL